MKVGKMTRELVDHLERQLPPFLVGAPAHERFPVPQIAITHIEP